MNPPVLPASDADPVEPPPYTRTLILATGLFVVDGLIGGQGFFSIATLFLGLPILLIRAVLARKVPSLFRRRLASVGIYAGAALVTVLLVRSDQAGARTRAKQVIVACEEFKRAKGDFPKTLAELAPQFLPVIPHARRFGFGRKDFTYLVGGPHLLAKGTNDHVLVYTVIPPIGRNYYHFEEKRWGFYD